MEQGPALLPAVVGADCLRHPYHAIRFQSAGAIIGAERLAQCRGDADLLNTTVVDEQPLSLDTLQDPNSDEVCMLLFLYSIEPPIYWELNEACIEMDRTKLHSLGPYARVIFVLINGGFGAAIIGNNPAERNRKDRLE